MSVTTKITEHSLQKRITFTFSRLIISMIIFCFLVFLIIYQAGTLVYTMEDTDFYGAFISSAFNLSKSLALERGYAGILIAGADVEEELIEQRALTDFYVEEYGAKLKQHIQGDSEDNYDFDAELQSLRDFRQEVDDNLVTVSENLDFYADFVFTQLTRVIEVFTLYGDITSTGYNLHSYAMLLEYISLRRGVFGVVAVNGYFDAEMRYRILDAYGSEQTTLKQLLTTYSAAEQLLADNYYSDPDVMKALEWTESLTEYVMLSDNYTLIVDPVELFNNFTLLITNMNLGPGLLEILAEKSHQKEMEALLIFIGYTATMVLEMISVIWFIYIAIPVVKAYGAVNQWICCNISGSHSQHSQHHSLDKSKSRATKSHMNHSVSTG